jgi:hypothetical protein
MSKAHSLLLSSYHFYCVQFISRKIVDLTASMNPAMAVVILRAHNLYPNEFSAAAVSVPQIRTAQWRSTVRIGPLGPN